VFWRVISITAYWVPQARQLQQSSSIDFTLLRSTEPPPGVIWQPGGEGGQTPGFVIENDFFTNQTAIGRTLRHYGLNNEIPFDLTIINQNTVRIIFDTANVTAHNQFLRIPLVMQRIDVGHIYSNIINRSPNLHINFNSSGYRLTTISTENETPQTSNIERISDPITIAYGITEIPRAIRRVGHYVLDLRNAQGTTFRLRNVETNTFTLQGNTVAIAAVRINGIAYYNVVGAYVPEYISWNNNGRAITIRDVEDAEVTFYLSAMAGSTGHINIGWTGGSTRIATVVPAIDIDVSTTVLSQGMANQDIHDIIIRENIPGVLSGQIGVQIEYINLLTDLTVTATNGLDIRRESGNNLRVFSRSQTNPATVTIAGLQTNVPTNATLGYRTLTITNMIDNSHAILNGNLRNNQNGFHRFAFDTDNNIVIERFLLITPGEIIEPPPQEPHPPVVEEEEEEQSLHIIISHSRAYAYVNGRQVPLTTGDYPGASITPPINHNNRLFVPVRALSLLFGENVRVHWNPHTAVATIIMNGITVTFENGSNTYTVNGQPRQMDAAAFVSSPQFSQYPASWNRIYVPFRFFGYAFGFDVSWNAQTAEAHFQYVGTAFNIRRIN